MSFIHVKLGQYLMDTVKGELPSRPVLLLWGLEGCYGLGLPELAADELEEPKEGIHLHTSDKDASDTSKASIIDVSGAEQIRHVNAFRDILTRNINVTTDALTKPRGRRGRRFPADTHL